MTKTITYPSGDPLKLVDDLQAVPGLAPLPAADGKTDAQFTISQAPTGTITLVVPDATDQAAVDAVYAAHDPVPAPRFVDYVQAQQFDAKTRTTDATPRELWRTTLPTQTAYLFTAQVVGVDAGNGAALRFEAKYSVKRLNAGVVQIGTPVVVCDQRDSGAASWRIDPAMAGNDVLLRVTGAAGRTIDWIFSADAALYAPAGLAVV